MIHLAHTACALVTILMLAAVPTTALSAPYTVHSCAEGVRESIPTTDWAREAGAGSFTISVDCSEGAVTVRPTNAHTLNGGGAGIRFTAPAPLGLIGMKHRQVMIAPKSVDPARPWEWEYFAGVIETDGTSYRNRYCFAPCNYYLFNPGETFERPRRSIWWYIRCVYETDTYCGRGAEVRIFDARFEIDDPSPPRFLNPPAGAIFSGSADVTGHQTIGFDASDLGSGVYKADIDVDGSVLGSVSSSSTEYPHCIQPFRVVRPCPSNVTNGITIDTTQLSDGAHTATLRVYDATERNFASYGPITFTTANRRLSNYCSAGLLGLASEHLPKRPLTFGKSWKYSALTRDVAGFDVVLLEGRDRVAVVGSGQVPTDGRVAFRVPPGANRTLRLAVRAPGSTANYVCSKPSQLRVKARLRLAAAPDEVSNGRSVRLSGHLYGVANSRRPIVIQARAAGSRRWATVRVVRTRQNGRFAMRYRFLSTFSTVTYIFRAQARSANRYPYATGTSRHRRIRVFGAGS